MIASAIRILASADSAPIIAAGQGEKLVHIYDLHQGGLVSEFQTVLSFGGERLALSPDGLLCAAAGWNKGSNGGVAVYQASSGACLWHRQDLKHTQRIRFSPDGRVVYCGRDEGPLLNLDAQTGETMDSWRGIGDAWGDPRASRLLVEDNKGLLLKGESDHRIWRTTFAFLAVTFGVDSACVSESGGPVRCIDGNTGGERWRYTPDAGSHVLELGYNQSLRRFFGVIRDYEKGSFRRLLSWSEETGQLEDLMPLNSWEEVFCLGGTAIVTSEGEVFDLETSKLLHSLSFPRKEYPDRQ